MEDENDLKLMKWFDAIYKNRFFLSLLFLSIFLLASIFYFKTPSAKKEQLRYFNAKRIFSNWDKNPLDTETESFLIKSLRQSPQLFSKYDYQIAQKYLVLHENAKAVKYGQKAIERLEKKSATLAEFSQNALLRQDRGITRCLKDALLLKANLNKDQYPVLYAFNLLRIANLQHAMKEQDEVKTLQELEEWTQNSRASKFLKAFQESDISFQNYLEYRKKQIDSRFM